MRCEIFCIAFFSLFFGDIGKTFQDFFKVLLHKSYELFLSRNLAFSYGKCTNFGEEIPSGSG